MQSNNPGLIINAAGDFRGNLVGVVVDVDHNPAAGAKVSMRLLPRDTGRNLTTSTDSEGAFTVDVADWSAGVTATHIQISCTHNGRRGSVIIPVSDLSLRLTHIPPDPDSSVKLSGEWRFQPDPPSGFWEAAFDDRAWKSVRVPGHWVFDGFDPQGWVGGYRRWVEIPDKWRGDRVILRFDGVHTGCEVWVNGVRAGSHDGGAVPFEFDVTDLIRPGEPNLFSVRVSEDSATSYLDAMSMYAHFPLGGIYRGVRLFAVPPVHIARLQAETVLDRPDNDAVLRVSVTVANQSGERVVSAPVALRLSSTGGKSEPVAASRFVCELGPWSTLEKTVEIRVKQPRRWDIEHPNLYELRASVESAGKRSEAVRKVGFRTVEIAGSEFLLNGVPIKLKGANRHDSHPLMGRAITPDIARQDLELMRGCNMNSFRTSHYPPIEEVIDLASEMGFGVEEEAALCFVGIPWGPRPGYYPDVKWANGPNPARDPWYIPLLVQQAAGMIERDRSQPSVLWWSLSNESDSGPAMQWLRRWVRQADPSRPVTGSGDSDIAIYHNPTLVSDVIASKKFQKPVLAEEALAIFQGFDENNAQLYLDPGMRDLWAVPLIDVWEEIERSPWYLGAFTWAWADDCFLIPGYGIEHGRYDYEREQFELSPYLTPDRGIAGEPPWGIVDGWRRPRPEWWLHKKLFSPIKISERPLSAPEAGAALRVPVENRYCFTNLDEVKCRWRLGEASGVVECDVPPRTRGVIEIGIPRAIEPDGQVLELEFRDRTGLVVDAYRLHVGERKSGEATEKGSTPPKIRQERTNLGGYLQRVVGDGFELAFSRSNGRLCRGVAGGRQVLLEWPVLHVLPNTDAFAPKPDPRTWQCKSVVLRNEGDAVVVTIDGAYHEFEGRFVITIDGSGLARTEYKFAYSGPEMQAREVGVRMLVPSWLDTLEWTRNAEWSVYPADHIGRPHGTARAFEQTGATVPPTHSWASDASPMGSNDFRSTKRNITSAGLLDSKGAGVRISSDGTQAIRACVGRLGIDLCVLDYYGGTRSSLIPSVWEPNYGSGKPLKAGDIIEGVAHLRLVWSHRSR